MQFRKVPATDQISDPELLMLTARIIIVALFLLVSTAVDAFQGSAHDLRKTGRSPGIIYSASELDYPPFALVREDGTADGFSVDLLRMVAEKVGVDVRFHVGPWNEIKSELISRKIDALPLVSYSKARDEVMDFTVPYLRMHGTIFVRKGDQTIKSEADLKDKEVLVMRGDTAHEYAKNHQLARKLILTESFEDAFSKLSGGLYDAVIAQHLVGLQLIKKLGIKNVVSVESFGVGSLKPTAKPLSGFEQKFCIAVSEGDKELLSTLNEGLSLVITSGAYDELYEKWFGPILPKAPIDTQTILKYVVSILLPILAVVGILGIWVLRREVTNKTGKLKEQVAVVQAAEKALKVSEAHLRTLVNSLPDLIWLKDPDGIYLSCNPRFERFFGATEAEIVGKTDYDFVDPVLADSFRVNDQVAMEKGKPHRNEEAIVFADDGHREILETIKTPMSADDGRIIGVLGIGRDITARKQTEVALRESEEKFRLTFMSSPDAVNINRLKDGSYVEINEGFTRLTGFTSEDVVGRTPSDINIWHDPKDRDRLVKTLQAHGFCENLEAQFRKKDGSLTTALMSARTITLNGELHIISIARDISDRKQYESEREITLHILQALHRENDLHGLIRDITGLMKNWSGCEAVGVRLQDGEDFPYFETAGFPPRFVASENRLCTYGPGSKPIRDEAGNPVLECMCGNVIRGRFNLELPFFTENGSFWTNSTTDLLAATSEADRQARTRNRCHGEGYESVALIPLAAGVQTMGLLQFNDSRRDRFDERTIALFERLAASLAIGLSQRITALALQESEAKYRSIMEAMDDAVYICSNDFRVEYMNPAMINWIGYDAVGKLCHDVLHGADQQCPNCIQERVMRGENVSSEVQFPEIGKTYHVSNSPVYHADGSVSKLTIFRDITDIKNMENRIQQAQKMESIGVLAGGIAHDFNNILFPIMGLSEMLLEDLPDGSFEHENVTEIHKAAKRAGDLVKQILSFSRQVEQKKMPIRIQHVIKEIVKLMRATIPSNISITQDVSNDCGMVLADPTQIHQIGMNLITNAYHAVEEAGGVISIGLKMVQLTDDDLTGTHFMSDQYAVLSIADTGHGIDPQLIDKIFEPYFTTKVQGKGTGLGLSVVYGIVEDHGGFIRVDSEVNRGSIFRVHLPIINNTGEENRLLEDALFCATGNERILLVDDEAAVVKLEKQMLERLGYLVEERVSSLEALRAFEAKPDAFDLVITDMTMPHLTGDQLARKLMRIRRDIPVIICTGFSERINRENAAALGVKGLLYKPVVKSDMARMIRDVLNEAGS